MTTSAIETGGEAETEAKTFPYQRACPFSPPPEYTEMVQEDVSQVTLTGSGLRIWTVTGYHTIRQLLTDPRVSASRKHANFPFYFIAPPEFRTETSFIGYDGQEHVNTRRKAALTFTSLSRCASCARGSRRSSTSTSTRCCRCPRPSTCTGCSRSPCR
ncbi:hypothetical protein LUW77_17910 [Streptomyces radiopugnans]|nr:hypothetical protein LUW77_17910 [Streptomyces radiopugnans]